MMRYKVLSAVVFIALVLVEGVSSADSLIWSGGVGGQGLAANPAAKFNITGLEPTRTSASTTVNYFTDTACTVGNGSITTNGNFTFSTSIPNVQANGTSIWGFNPTATTQSIQVIPYASAGGGGGSIFNEMPCFSVTCATNQCVYVGAAVTVTLVPQA